MITTTLDRKNNKCHFLSIVDASELGHSLHFVDHSIIDIETEKQNGSEILHSPRRSRCIAEEYLQHLEWLTKETKSSLGMLEQYSCSIIMKDRIATCRFLSPALLSLVRSRYFFVCCIMIEYLCAVSIQSRWLDDRICSGNRLRNSSDCRCLFNTRGEIQHDVYFVTKSLLVCLSSSSSRQNNYG